MRRLMMLAALWCGCAPIDELMRPSPGPLSMAASSTTARVIFARPARFFGGSSAPTLFDPQRQVLLGQAVADTYFAVDLEPGVYQVCPALIRFGPLGGQHDTIVGQWWFDQGARMPITQLEVAAGRTYLLRVTVARGPLVRAWPVVPGSEDEKSLVAELRKLRPAVPAPTAREYKSAQDPEVLEKLYKLCLDSSGAPETWLRVLPDESVEISLERR